MDGGNFLTQTSELAFAFDGKVILSFFIRSWAVAWCPWIFLVLGSITVGNGSHLGGNKGTRGCSNIRVRWSSYWES